MLSAIKICKVAFQRVIATRALRQRRHVLLFPLNGWCYANLI